MYIDQLLIILSQKCCWEMKDESMKNWLYLYVIVKTLQVQLLSFLNWDFFRFSKYWGLMFRRFRNVKCCKSWVDPCPQPPVESHHLCQCLFSDRLESSSHHQPPCSLLCESVIFILYAFFFECASVGRRGLSLLLPPPHWVKAVTQPQLRLSFSTVLQEDVTDAARRPFKRPVERQFILLQSFQRTHSYSRFQTILRAAIATNLTPPPPQD